MAQKISFGARKVASPDVSSRGSQTDFGKQSNSDDSRVQLQHQFTNAATELTRSSKYVVSKLAASPTALFGSNSLELQGSIDDRTGHGLLISDELIYTWNYNSSDSIPNTIQIPVVPSNNGFPPLVILVLPSAGSKEPGVVSVNSHTGHIRFYENVGEASSFGLLQHFKGIDHQISLYDRETIEIAENVEPAGVLLTTSTGRVILLSLRNSAGKPFISSSQIVHRQTGFFSTTLSPSRHIVSVKAGAILGQGERIITTVTRGGDFQVWSCARDGQSRQIFQKELLSTLVEHVGELYPNATRELEILDMCLLPNFENQDAFLVLSSFPNCPNETFYLLFTIRKEADQLLIVSAYKLNTYTTPYSDKPKLYVPAPGTTGFIVFDNSVVLSELVSKLDHTSSLKKKWEDIITFRSNIRFIGSGAEDQTTNNGVISRLASLYLIAGQTGVLRVDHLNTLEGEIAEDSIVTGSFLKSHIEQAIFYGEDSENPIKFDLSDDINIDPKEVETDLLQVAEELLNSTSAYLPPRLSSLQAHLELRKAKLEKLLKYTAANFINVISDDVKFKLISALERISAASRFHQLISTNQANETFIGIVNKSLSKLYGSSKSFDELFVNGLFHLNAVAVDVLEQISKGSKLEEVGSDVIIAIYFSVLEIEKEYRYDLFKLDNDKVGKDQPWYTTHSAQTHIDDVFVKYTTLCRGLAADDRTTKKLVTMTEILFYQFQQKLTWLEAQTPKTRDIQDSINKDQSSYKSRSGVWTKSLILFGAKTEALAIAETYRDLKSLVEISDEDRENSEGEELERVLMRFDNYFHTFGYEFAETLYNYYISSGKFQVLLLAFQQYNEFLQRFFAENDHGKISWIRDILDGHYSKASQVLFGVTQKQDGLQSNRHLQLSVAKLGALAALENDPVHTNTTLLDDIQQQLDYVEVQDLAYFQISDFIRSDGDPAAQVDAIVQETFSQHYSKQNFPLLKNTFERALSRLLSNKSLSVNELIDTFTFLKPRENNRLNHFCALKLLHLSNLSVDQKELNERLIWRRAILSDDWDQILAATNKTDDYIKERAEETVLFTTLVKFFEDKLYTLNNGYQISLPDVQRLIGNFDDGALLTRFKFIGSHDLPKLKKELSSENERLQDFASSDSFDKWVKALIGTANERSGASKVINYNTLKIENNE